MGAKFLEGTCRFNNAARSQYRVICSSVFFVISLCLTGPFVSLCLDSSKDAP